MNRALGEKIARPRTARPSGSELSRSMCEHYASGRCRHPRLSALALVTPTYSTIFNGTKMAVRC